MTIYAVGDLQGCLTPLKSLLSEVHFNPKQDQLWCAGDVINRGPESLETLRFLYQLGDACQIVLGNHDLHLLAVAFGDARFKKGDTLKPILTAKDSKKLLGWLRQQPLIHHDHGYTMVHAGIPACWSIEKAISLSKEVEDALKNNHLAYLTHMYGNQPDRWDDSLTGLDRLRCITNYLTRMRYIDTQNTLDLTNKIQPALNTTDALPWFEYRVKQFPDDKILFGHWASLNGECEWPNLFALDTGCVWGGCLTMMRLSDQAIFRYHC
ncbi:MAG: symmetrical bis(5'-nucleosyl)-tetraphosphatase [Cellvibrionales bacterium]|nr:symmetrical bis(5'-nucleosyl)-tetraphosphatase [Cellvibrionales bacterium]